MRANNIKVAKNFWLWEFESPDTKEVIVYREGVVKLQALRDGVGRAVNVSRGYSTPQHNTSVGGKPNSYHKKGMAWDIWVKGMSHKELGGKAASVGFRGVIVEKDHVHVDIRLTPYREGL